MSDESVLPNKPEWLIPFQGRNVSGGVNVNLLWRYGCVYVMDNHRLAPWCFWQHSNQAPKWRLLHIDRHYDAIWDNAQFWQDHVRAEHREDLQSYLGVTFKGNFCTTELFRWDTVLTAAVHSDPERFSEIVLATGGAGDPPVGFAAEEMNPWRLIWNLEYAASPDSDADVEEPWWIDLDLDYFTTKLDVEALQLCSAAYIKRIGDILRMGVESGRFAVVTIALSPETTGSWELAEEILLTLLGSWPEMPRLPH